MRYHTRDPGAAEPNHPSWYLFVGVPDQKSDRKIHNNHVHRLYIRFKFPIIACLNKMNRHIPHTYFSDVHCIGYVRPYPMHFSVYHFVKWCSVLYIHNKKCTTYILMIFYISSALLHISMHQHHLRESYPCTLLQCQ